MSPGYHLENIRALLTKGFTHEELRQLSYDFFRPVYDELAPNTGKAEIIQQLLEYIEEREPESEALLAWAKEENPALYQKYQPYRVSTSAVEKLAGRLRRWLRQLPVVRNTSAARITLLALSLITILLLLLTTAGSLWQRVTATPTPRTIMPDGFNIAVAQFGMTGEVAGQIPADSGWSVADWLARSIEGERSQHPDIMVNEIWGPDKVGVIAGEDQGVRAANAAQFAENYNVNILIYGIITGSQSNYELKPEFYVAWHGFDYASEVAGPEQLGRPISLQFPFENPDKNELNNELKARRRVLHHVVYGLGYFYFNNYTDAFKEFNDASGEAVGAELEVVHLLKGAAKIGEYSAAPCKSNAALMQAQDAFTQAFQLNPNYGRSYLGLGSVALEQAKIFNADCTGAVMVKPDKLLEARNWFSDTLNLKSAGQSTPTPVQVKATFNLGLVNLLGYQAPMGKWSKAEARRFFQQAATAYQPGQRPDLVWVAGQAHANLGYLAKLDEDWLTMFCEYRRAVEILNTLPAERSVKAKITFYQQEIAFVRKQLTGEISCEAVTE